MSKESMRQSGYALCTDKMLDFLDFVWVTQGRTSKHCTGMSSFSFHPEHLTFCAGNDIVISAHLFIRAVHNDLTMDEESVCYARK